MTEDTPSDNLFLHGTIPMVIISDDSLKTITEELVANGRGSILKIQRKGWIPTGKKLAHMPVDLGFEPKDILPVSGSKIVIKSKPGVMDKYYLSVEKSERTGLFDFRYGKRNGQNELEVNKQQAKTILESLRISQLIYVGLYQRRLESDEVHPILSELHSVSILLEEIFDGRLDRFAKLESIYKDLHDFYSNRFKGLISIFSEDLVKGDSDLSGGLNLGLEHEKMYFNYKLQTTDYNLEKYLQQPPDYDIEGPLQETVRSLVKDFLRNSYNSAIKLEINFTAVKYPFPPLQLPNLLIEPDPYDVSRVLCNAILESTRTKPDHDEKLYKTIADVQKKIDMPLNLHKLISSPPQDIHKELSHLLLNGNHKEVMHAQMERCLPNLLPKKDANENTALITIFQKTTTLRGTINTIQNRIEGEQSVLAKFESSKESQTYAYQLKPKLAKIQAGFTELKSSNDYEKAVKAASGLQGDLNTYKKLRERKSAGIAVEDSLLWIGLGQGGGQILRECIMYCLDNLTDSRAMALLYALGIREKHEQITELLEKLYDDENSAIIDNKSQKGDSPEELLSQIFTDDLHILAMNLGPELLDLTMKEKNPRSHFIWGKNSEQDSGFEVERHTKNTLRLTGSGGGPGGAGGATGIGRAFGFSREKQISKVMKEIATKGGRTPKHVVITHSLAGGSGSGMVLPILEYVRGAFPPETIIWVMSVGPGASERKESDKYNTTFILSDILQSHYDGIHMPIHPIDWHDWRRFTEELKSTRQGMDEASSELVKKLDLDSVKKLNEIGFNRKHSEVTEKFRSLKDINNDFCPLKRDVSTFSGTSKDIGFLSELPSDVEFDKESIFGIEEVLKYVPSEEKGSKSFDKWCWYKTPQGGRPALEFWMQLNQMMIDPLGYSFQGQTRINRSKSRENEGTIEQFVPELTSGDLDKIADYLKIQLENIWISKENERTSDNKERITLPVIDGLTILTNKISEHIMGSATFEQQKTKDWWLTEYTEFRDILLKYGSHLDEFNNTRTEFITRVRSFSGAGKDDRIRNIVISNSHLEKGVDQSQIDRKGKSYTVYNSVLFDLMMNIIGPRFDLPIYSSGESSSAEKFDDQDLIQNTVPPLVVGLVEMNDSKTMAESPRVRPLAEYKRFSITEKLEQLTTRIMYETNLSKELANPLGFIPKGELSGYARAFIQSYFGTRIVSILQHDPYDVMNQKDLMPTAFNDFEKQVVDLWNSDDDFLNIPITERNTLNSETAISGYHVVNFYKWISIIDTDLFKYFLPVYTSIDRGDSQRKEKINDKIFETWKNNYTIPPEKTPQFDGGFIFESGPLREYKALAGDVESESLGKALSLMGIWNDDVLRSLSPAYFNTYLPITLLHLAVEDAAEGPAKTILSNIKDSYFAGQHTKSLNQLPSNRGKDQYHTLFTQRPDLLKDVQSALYDYNLKLDFGARLIIEQKTSEPTTTLRLSPSLVRYFSAIRDVPSPNEERMLPVKSPSANLPRYLLPDQRGAMVRHSRPVFTKAIHSMKILRFCGLLPDEERLNLSSLLRMLLLSDLNYKTLEVRLKHMCEVEHFDLNTFAASITKILEHESNLYTDDMISTSESSLNICNQASVLRSRMIYSRDFCDELLKSLPNRWGREKDAIKYWVEFVNNQFKNEIKSKEVQNYNGLALKGDLISFQKYILHGPGSLKNNQTTEINEVPIQNIKRLIYDISSNLGESLLQAEFMGSDDKTSRVHFSMTGFSDELIGAPSGILTLIHTTSNADEVGDTEQDAVRNSIEDCIGFVKNAKVFNTQAPFGPRCAVTVVMQKAPSAEISKRFVAVMEELAGNDKYEYATVAKIHPYAFLYNVLWMSANVHKWTSSSNVDYMKKFNIPSDVIEYHFTDIGKLIENVSEAQQTYEGTGVDFPGSDVALFNNVLSSDPSPHRNIIDLIGIMAVRHMKHRGDDKEKLSSEWNDAGLEKEDFELMYGKYKLDALKVRKECLILDSSNLNQEIPMIPGLDLDLGILDGGNNDDNNYNDCKKRCIEWFKAYKSWESRRSRGPVTGIDGLDGETLG